MFPVSPLDLMMHGIGRRSWPFMLWGLWDLPWPLDPDRLARATGRLLSRIPQLGCRLHLDFFRARFVPVQGFIPEHQVFCASLPSRDACERRTQEILARTLDAEKGPLFEIHHLEHPAGTRLVFFMHHCIADGRGMARVMEELAYCYASLGSGRRTLPPRGPVDLSRGIGVIARGFRPGHWLRLPLAIWREQIVPSLPGRSLLRLAVDRDDPNPKKPFDSAAHLPIVLDDEQFGAVKRACAERRVTVNDFLMTGLCLALKRWNGSRGAPLGSNLPLALAADLRQRYAPGASPISNLVAVHRLWFPVRHVTTFAATLQKLKRRIDSMKRVGLGIEQIALLLAASWLPIRISSFLAWPMVRIMAKAIGKMTAWTNIGVLPERIGDFGGGLLATQCSVVAPIYPGRTITLAVTSYRDRLTIELGYDRRVLDLSSAQTLAEMIAEEIRLGVDEV